jgi:hypothetical protein
MATVFISSTKPDLIEYRQGAIDICNRLGLQTLAMEHFEAEGAGGAEGSKRQLDEADVYIGIFAHRYGRITEDEFDYAGERGIERLCFVVDDSYSWPLERIDFRNKDALDALKAKVNELIRARFTTVDDFRFKIMQGLVSWMERHQVARTENVPGEQSALPTRITPIRPDLVRGREEDANRIKARLGIPSAATKQTLTIIRGWPGVGKTTLINSLVYDEAVMAAYGDGILWAVLGENGNPFAELVSWSRQLGIYDIANVATLEEAIIRLKAILHDKQMLLIIDDVWELNDAVPFKQVLGQSCHLIVSTRFPGVAQQLANRSEDIYLLDVLNDENAFALLRQLAPTVTAQYPTETLALVHALEGLPLAIRVAGRLLTEDSSAGFDVVSLITEIRENRRLLGAAAPDNRFDPKTGTTPTINFLLQRSTTRLDAQTRDYFARLGVFAPKPATFDLPAMQFIWEIAEENQAKTVVRTLVNRGLLEPIPKINRFQMHSVLVIHAQSLLLDE